MIRPFRRLIAALLPLVLLSACAGREDLTAPPTQLGNFQLGYTIIFEVTMIV